MFIPLLFALSFLTGVALASKSFWCVSGVFFLVAMLLMFWRQELGLVLFLFLLGWWRVDAYEQGLLVQPPNGFLELEGEIVAEIDRRQDHQKITVDTEYGRVLAKISAYEELEYGDRLILKGELKFPSDDIEGFNYAAYLARYRISLVMQNPGVDLIARGPPSFRRSIYIFKSSLERRINRLFMEPEASFVAGLLLGSRKGMPEELALAFQRVGLTHIVAISGYNISLVIAMIFVCFGFLSLRWRILVSSFAIFLFVILVGASAAVVRAGIMGVLTLWAIFSGRKSQVFFVLLWSGLIMVIFNPYTLLYDVGFQLSFASTFGLLVFVPILEKWTAWWTRALLLKEALLLTLAAQIATFPITAYEFGRLSLIAPIANVLAAPFIPLGMLFSALALVVGLPFVLLSWLPLKLVEWVALGLAKLPYIDVPLEMGELGYLVSWLVLIVSCIKFYKPTLVRAFVRASALKTSTVLAPQSEMHERPPPFLF